LKLSNHCDTMVITHLGLNGDCTGGSGMRKLASFYIILIFILLSIIGTGPLHAQWVKNGVPITTLPDSYWHRMIPDGSSGAVVIWSNSSTDYDLYAQRIDINGYVQWTVDGTSICSTTNYAHHPALTSDGAGGAFITWQDQGPGAGDIYAQKINSAGLVQWITNGVSVCSAADDQWGPCIVPDGAGGVIIAWEDWRTGDSDIYAQRLNADGSPAWTVDGIVVCAVAGYQSQPAMIADGMGGAIICWTDGRLDSNGDIYAVRIDASGATVWPDVVICDQSYQQKQPIIISDGAGGAIITWPDQRGIFWRPYCQRVDSTGVTQWTEDGIPVCLAGISLTNPSVAEDGYGGVLVAWEDNRNSDPSIYAQRIDTTGAYLWTSDGALVCTQPGLKHYPAITSDGAGGAIVTWEDGRITSTAIFVQILDSNGAMQLVEAGGTVCVADLEQAQPIIASDSAGGAIAVWKDNSSSAGLLAQRIDADDGWYPSGPAIESITDISPDEGGYVRIKLLASIYDRADAIYVATNYNVWRKIDALTALNANSPLNQEPILEPSTFLIDLSDQVETAGLWLTSEQAVAFGLPPGNWESLGQHAALQDSIYYFVVPTKRDSSSSGIPWETYMVTVHTTDPTYYIASEPDSGYSVDNLAPGMPAALAGEPLSGPGGVVLAWDDNAESDLSHYAVYRGETEDFLPGPGNIIGTPTESGYTDEYDMWHQSYYKVSAIDRHDNESPHAELGPDEVTGDETPTAPSAAYLTQNHPNPFNPSTRFDYGLPAPTHVRIRIYDAAGRLVRTLVNERREAGTYSEMWDGRDDSGHGAASGIYFYSLITSDFKETKKMVLLR
jgi:hypothetical protein